MYFWVHLNVRTTCVIFSNLFWNSVFQYTITNHTSGSILVTNNFHKPDFIGPVKESWRYMLLLIIPSEWMWHYVYIIWPCPGLSMIFQDEIFYECPMIFLVWILDSDSEKFLHDSISFLDGLYSPFYASVSITGCVWPRFLIYIVMNWWMIGCREVYITTAPILNVLVIIPMTSIYDQQVIGFWGLKSVWWYKWLFFLLFYFFTYFKLLLNRWFVMICYRLFPLNQLTLIWSIHIFIALIDHVIHWYINFQRRIQW